MRRYMAFMGSGMFCVVCFSLYLMLESTTTISGRSPHLGENDMDGIEAKIKQIEADLQRNHKTINLIKETIRDLARGDPGSLDRLPGILNQLDNAPKESFHIKIPKDGNFSLSDRRPVDFPSDMCHLSQHEPINVDIQMMDTFKNMLFDNPDGGVWKQGYPITYTVDKYAQQSLKVFVVPHSHCDPGWLKTFEKYYSDQTKYILDLMLEKLEQYPKMRFIYAEMSFFSMWWSEITEDKRKRVIKLLKDGRLEIVTGGWVMTDEANAHYFSMLDQIIEGNQWLYHQTGIKPKTGWAIDPFGHSATMPYLLHGAGFKSTLIQRVHYSVKKHLAQSKNLEFMWQQNWDHDGHTGIFSHMMPFYSYDVPHTCGPDPKICCQFDFKRLPGSRVTCPWKIPPVPITDANVKDRAETLLDQYRKKSQLYRSNVVLIPLGDDFRYDKPEEWDHQYENYQKIFDYMNSHPELHVEASFGTLSDYFDAIYQRTSTNPGERPSDYPVLSGDLFTYADRDDHYWSGYYTSRPFYKRLDRIMEAHLRGSEILFSLAVARANKLDVDFPARELLSRLNSARRNLGLYQHHDGITGTAKDPVVADYGQRLLNSITDTKIVMVDSAHLLMTADAKDYEYNRQLHFFDMDESRLTHDSLPLKTLVKVTEEPRPVVFYNSLGQTRQSLVCIHVTDPFVQVRNEGGVIITSQINPFWDASNNVALDKYKLVFIVTVPGLGLSQYSVTKVQKGSNKFHHLANLTFYNSENTLSSQRELFGTKHKQSESFSVENEEVRAHFSSSTGMLESLTLKNSGYKMKAEIEFLKYGTVSAKDKSGAYLFMPDGPAKPIPYSKSRTHVVRGPLLQEVQIALPQVTHTLRVFNSPGVDGLGVDIINLVDIRTQSNTEMVMRIITDTSNKDREFFTDLNGFQIQRRKTMDKLPLQGNYYPVPTMAYIEDEHLRFTVMTGQSLGGASLNTGWLEFMQDRRLNQDDNRGLGQGVLDNKLTPNIFRLLPEERHKTKQTSWQAVGFPSLASHQVSLDMLHPIHTMAQRLPSTFETTSYVSPLTEDLPCDVHLLNLRTMQSEEQTSLPLLSGDVGLLLHRLGTDCDIPSRLQCTVRHNNQIILGNLFRGTEMSKIESTSFSFLQDHSTVDPTTPVELPSMEIKAFRIQMK